MLQMYLLPSKKQYLLFSITLANYFNSNMVHRLAWLTNIKSKTPHIITCTSLFSNIYIWTKRTWTIFGHYGFVK